MKIGKQTLSDASLFKILNYCKLFTLCQGIVCINCRISLKLCITTHIYMLWAFKNEYNGHCDFIVIVVWHLQMGEMKRYAFTEL